jgi:imidazolonepropionase-like amidohydrolase
LAHTPSRVCIGYLLAALAGCGQPAVEQAGDQAPLLYASTYAPLPGEATVIENATILTGAGERIDAGMLIMRDGRIEAVGAGLDLPAAIARIDATGKWVTPGIIDNHSHLGVYPAPEVAAVADGNEISDPNTAQVWAEHAVWPQDPGFAAALAGGVTTLQILPGSANLFGGRSVVVKNVPARTVQEMKFPGAPHGLKMACGENPKRVYGFERLVAPGTRMGNVAGYRQAWAQARDYMAAQAAFDSGSADKAPEHNLQLETLAGVLRGEILVHNHCYRADEMAVMLDVAREFGYRIASFHHAVEAYKVADLLAESGTCAAMWADWWGFKLEAFDAVRENVAMVDSAGACAIVHSDSASGIQRLNQEAAKAMAAAQRSGIAVDHAGAMRWLSLNPARSLGIDAQTGSLEAGKMADVVIWDGDPFSVYTKAEKVFIDGALVFDRADPARQPVSDFELGLISLDGDAP